MRAHRRHGRRHRGRARRRRPRRAGAQRRHARGGDRGGVGGRARSLRGRRAAAGSTVVRILLWHVHGSWTTAFVHGPHDYLVPVVPDRGPDGRGRAQTWSWPASVVEVPPERLAREPVDVVVVQSAPDEALAARWLGGRCPGRDVPL